MIKRILAVGVLLCAAFALGAVAFAQEGCRLPDATDAVVIARHGAKELAVRDGLAGIQTALAELIDKVPGASSGADRTAAEPNAEAESDA